MKNIVNRTLVVKKTIFNIMKNIRNSRSLGLIVLALLFGSLQVWGDTETYTYSDYEGEGTSSTGSDYTMTKTYSSIGDTKFYGNSSYAQFYAGGVTTITPLSGSTITSVVLTATGTSYNGYQSSGTVTASAGTVTHDGAVVTWAGSRTSAFTISHNKQIRWYTIVVTYTAAASTYTVSYDANGGSGTLTDSNSPYNSGATVTVLANSFTAPDGYKFDHWNTAANDGGTDYDPTDQFTISANTTLYAQWAAKSLTNYRTSCSSTPTLSVSTNSLDFGNVAVNSSTDLTFTLNGSNLTAGATISVSGTGYSVSPTSVAKVGTSITNATITVTYHPTTTGDSQTGTVTITSSGADNKTVSLTGNSKATYTVTCSAASNGSVSSDKASAMEGETVTLTISPNTGYQLSTISAVDGSSHPVSLSGTGNERTFTMPASNVTVTSTFVVQTDYVLVTNVDQINDGDLITLCTVEGNSQEGYILDEQNSNNRARKSITTRADGKIAEADVAYPIVLESVVGGWKLKDQTNSNHYLYATYNSNYLRNAADPSNSVWTIAVNTTSHKATITTEAYNGVNHDTRYIQYNGSNSIFSAYKNSGTDCYIYKKELGCDKLAAPTGLSVTNKTTTTCTLNWNSVTGASGYEVSLDNGSTWTSNGSNTTYNVTAGAGWTAGSEHTWKVRATGDGDTYCAKGNAASNTVTMLHVYTVTYNANGGSGTLPIAGGVANVDEGGSHVVLGNIGSGGGAVLTKDGYTFANWHNSSSYSASPAYTVGSTISNITSNKILYANWSPKRDTFIDGVHNNADQYGDGANYAVPSCSDESQAASGACEVTHYKFIGWALEDADLTDPANIFKGGTKTATGATYYAVWGEEL